MKISIVIPVLNEEKTILATLAMVDKLKGEKEVLLVDGGSTDKTVELVQGKVQVLQSPAGRAKQMNYGAWKARGDVLFFLHSDSIMEADALIAIQQGLADPRVVGGGFTLALNEPRLIYRLIVWGSNLRPKLSQIFFGDQGIFVRREIFQAIGGFPDIELMEDWEFCRRLKKQGPLIQLPQKIITSARRWQKGGVWKTLWLMHKLKLLYLLGVPPRELKRMYYDVR